MIWVQLGLPGVGPVFGVALEMPGVASGWVCDCEAWSLVAVNRYSVSAGAGLVRFGSRRLNRMGKEGPNCVFARPVHKGALAGSVGVAMPASVTVRLNGCMPSAAGVILVDFPCLVSFACLVAAAAAAKENGECENQQGENAAYHAEDDVEWDQRIFGGGGASGEK